MAGTFTVQNGETLRAIAGGPGGTETDVAGGGGGGSGVVNCGSPSNCGNGTIWIIAAGGSGEGDADGVGGSSAIGGSGNGGVGGGGDSGGGGGGEDFPGDPGGGSGGGGGGGPVSKTGLATGGTGGNNRNNDGGNGMGAGGGGGDIGAGGGGGQTGGDGGDGAAPATSLNIGDDQNNSDGAPGTANNDPVGTSGTVLIVCLGPLPVELINFKAVIRGSSEVMLLWSTASEKDNLGYDVERSADNRNWTALGFVPGSGTSAEKHEYNFHDEKPLAGVNYYRLKQMDTDGQYQYTPMVVADVRGGGSQFDVFPNPSASGALSVRAVSTKEGDALLEVYSWAGLRVYKETFRAYEGTIVSPLDMTTFPKGTYTARLEMPDGTVQFRKIVLQ